MEEKRRCRYPGCGTVLRSGNKGDYCHVHEDRQYIEEVEHKPMRKSTIPAKEKMYTVQDLVRIFKYSDKTIRGC